jgi:hypothetical protein
VPKAGGSSVGHLLKTVYGASYQANYGDNPAHPSSQRVLDPGSYFARRETMPAQVRCIHGHFHPGKFSFSYHTVLFTLLRHPVDAVISWYFYWKQMERQNDPLHDYFLDHGLTIAETAQLPLVRWALSRTYFEGFDMGRFDIIGRYSEYEKALKDLSARIGVPFDAGLKENVTPESEARQQASENADLRNQLEDILRDDIRFYEQHTRG